MADKLQKTYSDSYIFNYDKNGSGKSIAKEINKKLIEYITTADRLDDKKSPAFTGIREEVKRQQASSLIYSTLMRDDVVLCINTIELPRAFKVFEAIDLKEGRSRKVFIDITGLVKLENGYYACKDIFKLITYLTCAVTYLLYRNDPMKFLNNSNVTLSATECYTGCVTFVLDYLRLVGYSESKIKIKYLTGLFFQHTLMGKDLDNYTKNVAAKVAGIGPDQVKAYELYYDKEDLTNIDTFINMLIKNFKLTGLSTELFITRWVYHFQKGTEYAIDLFTSFVNMILSAYCGTYIVNQKQIEKCCGKNMVKLAIAVLETGTTVLDEAVFTGESTEFSEYHSRETVALAEAMKRRSKLPDEAKFSKADFGSKKTVRDKAKALVKYYVTTNQRNKISPKFTSLINSALHSMDKTKLSDGYEVGVVEILINASNDYIEDNDRRNLKSDIDSTTKYLYEQIKKTKIKANKDLTKKITAEIAELRKCKNKL